MIMKKLITKTVKRGPKKVQKAGVEKEIIKGMTFYKIYKADGSMRTLTDQEFEIQEAEK